MARYLRVRNNVNGLGTGAIYYDLPSPEPEVWVTINVKPINIYLGSLTSGGGLIDFLNLPYTSYPGIEFEPKTLIGWSAAEYEGEAEPHEFVAGIGEDFFAPWYSTEMVSGGEVEDNIRVTISYGVTYQSREPYDGGYLLDIWEMHLYVNGVDQGTVEGQIEADVGGPTESTNIQSVSIFPSGLDWTEPIAEWRFYSIKIGTTGPGSSDIVDDDYENGDPFPDGGWGIQYPTESEEPEDQFADIIDDGIPEDPDPTDSDGDGWSDEDEIAHGTDPFDPNDFPTDPDLDSDDDGFPDEDEVDAGTDPFDPDSFPGSDTPPLSGNTTTVCRIEDVVIVSDATTDYEVVVSGQSVLSALGVSLQVSVFLEAVDIGDLKILIISPSGTSVVLSDHNGSPHTSLGVGLASGSMAVFDPNDASVTLDNWPEDDNVVGLVIPLNNFDAFAGEDPNGIWTFRVIEGTPAAPIPETPPIPDVEGTIIWDGYPFTVGDVPDPTPTPPTSGWSPGTLLRDLDFDPPGGNFDQWDDVLIEEYGSLSLVTSPRAEGQYAARMMQQPMNVAHKRVELQNHRTTSGAALANSNVERYYQFKFMPVRSGTIINGPPDFCISQFRVTNIFCYTGGINLNPGNGKLYYRVNAGIQSGCNFPVSQSYEIGTVKYNEFSTIQMHIRWSELNGGFGRIWYNGQLMAQHAGPTCGNTGPTDVIMFRVGIYAGYHTGVHEIIYDDVKMWGP